MGRLAPLVRRSPVARNILALALPVDIVVAGTCGGRGIFHAIGVVDTDEALVLVGLSDCSGRVECGGSQC